MVINDIGRVTPIWRGFYSAAATYELNDIVIDTAGSVWWHKSEELTTGVIPEAGEIWDAVIDMSVFSALIQAAITTAQTAVQAAQAAETGVAEDVRRAETAAQSAEASAEAASESAAGVGALAQAAEQSKTEAQTAATQAAASASSAGTSAASAGSSAQTAEAAKTAAQTAATQAAGSAETASGAAAVVEQKKAEAIAAIEAKGEEVLESIPEDYTELTGDVGDLKTQISDVTEVGFNLYNPAKNNPDKYLNTNNGKAEDSEVYAVSDYIPVPSGKTIRTVGVSNDVWSSARTVRSNCVYSAENEEAFLSGDNSMSTAYTYTNSTNTTQYIRYTIFVNSSDYTVTKLMVYYYDGVVPVESDYVPYKLWVDSDSIKTDEIAENIMDGNNEIKTSIENIVPALKKSVDYENTHYEWFKAIASGARYHINLGQDNNKYKITPALGLWIKLQGFVNSDYSDNPIPYETSALTGEQYLETKSSETGYYYRFNLGNDESRNPSATELANSTPYILRNVILNEKWLTPEETKYLSKTKNLYNPDIVIPTAYCNTTTGKITEDVHDYSVIAISVPAGKIVFVSANVDGKANRQLAYSVRSNCVVDYTGAVVTSDTNTATAYTYTNSGVNSVTVYFNLWYQSATHTAENVMIEIVDNVSDVKVTDYIPYGWEFTEEIVPDVSKGAFSDSLNRIENVENIIGTPKPWFLNEIQTTADTIRELTTKPNLTFNIITDTHVRPDKEYSVRQNLDSIANIKALNRICHTDGFVHLGDFVAQSMYTEDEATNDEVYATLQEYVKKYSDTNSHAYATNGNHDGKEANIYQQYEWYAICGRNNTDYAVKDGGTNYFYVDYPRINTRCIFMATPDNIDDANTAIFGYSARMLEWLVEEALDTPDNYNVIMFAHIAPFYSYGMADGMLNRDDFYGICKAYNEQDDYTGTVQNADFTGKSGTKIIAYICGHSHGDAVLEAGETVTGTDAQGDPVTTTNEMPCPVINIGAGFLTTTPMSDYGAVAPARADKTVTQDLWDTMVYRPDLNKIYMVRFGAGNDREIDV